MYYTGERTSIDNQNWHSGLIGKMFYHKCPDNDKYFRSIRVAHNPFTNSLQPQISNPIYGEPPEELKPISPMMLNRLMRQTMSSTIH